MDELDVGEFIRLYCDSINTKYDSKILPLSGFYRCVGNKSYGSIYYDHLYSKETGLKLTLLLNEEQREQLTDGKNYTIRGYINRSKKFDKNSSIALQFKALKIDGENREVQLVNEEEYDLLMTRYERGLANVNELILDKFDEGFRCRVAILTGNQSIVDQDFESQFSDTEKYHIELFRTNFSDANQIIQYLENFTLQDFELLAFMRGGGTGLEVFDNEKLCKMVLDLKKPFITALGHQEDLPMLSKLADKNLATPSAFGTYLQNIGKKYDERMSIIEGLQFEISKRDEILIKKQQELENITAEIRDKLEIRNSQLKNLRIWIAVLIMIIIGMVYMFYFR